MSALKTKSRLNDLDILLGLKAGEDVKVVQTTNLSPKVSSQ